MQTVFEWDERKAELNVQKHGVDFETAALAFADPLALRELNQEKDGELRWQLLGTAGDVLLLVVIHTLAEVDDDGTQTEVIRLISARRAEAKERRRYAHGDRSLQD